MQERQPHAPEPSPVHTRQQSGRIVSMDQFRGSTVAGMFVVNYVGGLAAMSAGLKCGAGLQSPMSRASPSRARAIDCPIRSRIRAVTAWGSMPAISSGKIGGP